MSNNNDFDDIDNQIDLDEIEDENNDFDFVSTPSPKIEEKKEETLKKKKIEEKTQKNFPFKSPSDSKPIRSPTSVNNQKTIDSLTQKTKELNNSLETLDFNVEKFNKFQSSLKTFKIWNTIILSIAALATGAILTFAIQNSMMKNQNNEEIIKILDEYQVQLGKDNKGELQLFVKKENGKSFATAEYQVLQIQKQK
jgi:hypothetical protein